MNVNYCYNFNTSYVGTPVIVIGCLNMWAPKRERLTFICFCMTSAYEICNTQIT